MQKRRSFLPLFLIFLVLSFLVIFLASHNLFFGKNLVEDVLFPVTSAIYKIVTYPANLFHNTADEKLQQENLSLRLQLVGMQKLQTENKALHDQFETTDVPTTNLLPAGIIGDPQFIPGISAPEALILNKGRADGLTVGMAVIYEKNIVGILSQVTDHTSFVTVVSNKATSFIAETSNTNAQGVLAGQGNGVMVLGSVLLSDKLQVGDMVVTTGSTDIAGHGIPPGFIVGKIISVDKNPSSLYQTASVKSLLQIEKLSTVFVMTGN